MKLCPACRRCFPETARACLEPGHPVLIEGPPVPYEVAGTWVLERLLSSHPAGGVFLGRSRRTESTATVLVRRPPEPDEQVSFERFRRESVALATLQEISIGGVEEFGSLDSGGAYAVLESPGEETLRDALQREGRFPIASALTVGRQLAEAAETLARSGIPPGEFAPDRVGLRRRDSGQIVVRLVRLPGAVDGESPPGSEIASIGALLYEMLSGKSLANARPGSPPAPIQRARPDVPEPLGWLIMQCLHPNPMARPRSLDEIVERLRALEKSDLAAPAQGPAGPFAFNHPLPPTRPAFAFQPPAAQPIGPPPVPAALIPQSAPGAEVFRAPPADAPLPPPGAVRGDPAGANLSPEARHLSPAPPQVFTSAVHDLPPPPVPAVAPTPDARQPVIDAAPASRPGNTSNGLPLTAETTSETFSPPPPPFPQSPPVAGERRPEDIPPVVHPPPIAPAVSLPEAVPAPEALRPPLEEVERVAPAPEPTVEPAPMTVSTAGALPAATSESGPPPETRPEEPPPRAVSAITAEIPILRPPYRYGATRPDPPEPRDDGVGPRPMFIEAPPSEEPARRDPPPPPGSPPSRGTAPWPSAAGGGGLDRGQVPAPLRPWAAGPAASSPFRSRPPAGRPFNGPAAPRPAARPAAMAFGAGEKLPMPPRQIPISAEQRPEPRPAPRPPAVILPPTRPGSSPVSRLDSRTPREVPADRAEDLSDSGVGAVPLGGSTADFERERRGPRPVVVWGVAGAVIVGVLTAFWLVIEATPPRGAGARKTVGRAGTGSATAPAEPTAIPRAEPLAAGPAPVEAPALPVAAGPAAADVVTAPASTSTSAIAQAARAAPAQGLSTAHSADAPTRVAARDRAVPPAVNRREPAPPAPGRAGGLRDTLDAWIDSTNARDLSGHMRFYLPQVSTFYLSRNVSREYVRREKARLFQGGPVSVAAGEPEIDPSPDGRTATVRFRKRYAVSGARGEKRGEVIQEMKWIRTPGGWRIASERDAKILASR